MSGYVFNPKGTRGPFNEDNWLFVKINGTIFRNASLCPRCPFIAVDPDEGTRNLQNEPLKTMKTFRASLNPRQKELTKGAPFFGLNLGIDQIGGTLTVEDDIFVIYRYPDAILMPMMLLFPLPILAMFVSNLSQT